MAAYQTQIVDFQVKVCPLCGHQHDYKLKAFSKPSITNVVLFGGAGDSAEVMFECDVTKNMFTYKVPVPDNTEIAGVATSEEIEKYSTEQTTDTGASEELKEWIKNSRSIALEFCKNILTTALGAIPVYFAILKYLGSEKIGTSQKFFILPPVLFLLAASMCAYALKPKFKIFDIITEEEFTTFKKTRLQQLNNFLVMGTSLFILGTITAIIVFFKFLIN